jgi:transposase InsO family protein
MIKPKLMENGIKLGRDALFDHLRRTNQLIHPRRSYVRTTQSSHRFRIYENLTAEFQPLSAHQLWVSDITYLRTRDGFCYLALITDAGSRKIVGFDVSNSLELSGCLNALKMALKQLPAQHRLIHHSDRGIQYCSGIYTGILQHHNIRISMAEKGNCYQNALAERINGILKNEFFLDQKFQSLQQAKYVTQQSIKLYNLIRPHQNLNYSTPQQRHIEKVM